MKIAYILAGLTVAYLVYKNSNVFMSGLPPNSFTMYYADWCPHCKSVLPEFQSFMNSYAQISVRAVEQKENNEFKVKGFPTFVFTDKNGLSTIFKGARNSEAWKKFIEKNM